MTNIDIGKQIAKELIKLSDNTDKSYYPLLKSLIDEYNLTNEDDENKIIMTVVHELTVQGYDIISIEPFKLKNLKD